MISRWMGLHCILCEKSNNTILCNGCRHVSLSTISRNGLGLRQIYTLAPYNSPIGRALKLAKCEPNRRLAQLIRQAFVDEGVKATSLIQPDYLVPVPSHWSRRIRRGFEITSLFSTGLSKCSGIPTLHSLKSHRWRRQSSLAGHARSWNLGQQLSWTQPITGHVLLIEDVITTGCTIAQCATQIIASGADEVSVLTLCHSPRHDTSQHLEKIYDNVR